MNEEAVMGLVPLPPLVMLVVVCLCWLRHTTAQRPARPEVVCRNVDIRNNVGNFQKLENCTVIEGYLQIILIDKGRTEDYDGLLFPDLVEITGYFLLYRAFGMNSIGKIFPNLAVIRGNTLFHNYAFVVNEMYQLQEIGLSRLTDILRGSVRIEKNPGLCYVDTVDWDLIAKEGKGGHYISGNKKWEECPNTCPEHDLCPKTVRNDAKSINLCWNSHNCQKICPLTCEQENSSCSDNFVCCHKECLGGCHGRSLSDCAVCRHVVYEGRCLKKCPPGTFEFLGRRCVQEHECKNYTYDENYTEQNSDKRVFWKAFMGQCREKCPPGYIEDDKDRHVCKECVGKCPKVCEGSVVDNVGAIQNYYGCTYIKGSLEITIKGGSNVIKELEENMDKIEEIQGYLKVARSFPLVSLNFLKSLATIHGESLDKKDYAFLVLDNQNLQELWDPKSHKQRLRILNGRIFFHFNSKLCPDEIKKLKAYADTLEWDDRDVSPSSNGDRIACNVTNMNVTVYSLTPSMVKIKWISFSNQLDDERSLLGYVIYYREAPYRNITMFEGRDACGADVWTVRDVEVSQESGKYIYHNIANLKPFTQYALYIRTYTTKSGKRGAQSSIVYFKTEPYTPSPPVNIKARSTLHGEIVISWKPPKRPNGDVTHYIVTGIYEEEPEEFINQRNYCLEPRAFPDYKSGEEDELKYLTAMDNGNSSSLGIDEVKDCCPCTKTYSKFGEGDDDAEFQMHFEDFLQNQVYCKNPFVFRRKRQIYFQDSANISALNSTELNLTAYNTSSEIEEDAYLDGNLVQFKRYINHNTFLVISNLKHFAEYTIKIRACQDTRPRKAIDNCSTKAITSVRTLHLAEADDIKAVHVTTDNSTSYSGFVRWEEPKDPNGVIVTYTLEYRRLNGESKKPNRICVTRTNYLERNGYFLPELAPGNYSLRVRATSLAGHGNWSAYTYFFISTVTDDFTLEVVIVLAVAILVSVMFGTLYGVYKWKFSSRIPDYVDYASVNPEYMSSNLVYVPDEWEIPREKVKLLEELGQGSFGMVYKGEVYDLDGKACTPCAAKTVNESATLRERIEFLQEASVMKAFDCHHVIKLLGVVSKGQPTLVIMELMTNGDLKSYLRSHRPDSEENPGQMPPTLIQILQMAAEIADGMAYLVSRKFVHRDLAARNCMVAEDLTVKIGDFGMTRDVYETDYYRKGDKGLLPIRWMAPESLKDGIFDSHTDIWSFGIVLWEMATMASQPYQGLSNEEVLKFVVGGNIMEKPEDCPEKLYTLMLMCWHKNPKARPTFIEIIEMLLPEVTSKFHKYSYYFTQYRLMNTDNEDSATPSTALRSAREYILNEQQEYKYFPSATQLPEEITSSHEQCDMGQSASFGTRTFSATSNEGSKGISVTYSDGSKGSKISSMSNGSISNGHLNANYNRATEC